MKLHDRVPVDGTTPVIYIGHREFKDRKSGRMIVCKQWHAYWNHEGKKYDESLKTSNKASAIRAAHKIVGRIERGDVRVVLRRVVWEAWRNGYIESVEHKNRAPKTIEKYKHTLDCFISFMKGRNRSWPEKTSPANFWAFSSKMRKDGLGDGNHATGALSGRSNERIRLFTG